MAARPALLVLALLGCRAPGQVVNLERAPVPGSRSLQVLRIFHVYSEKDAPARTTEKPSVTFRNLVAHSSDPEVGDIVLADYQGVQLSLLPAKNFWSLIKPEAFCSTGRNLGKRPKVQHGELVVQGDGPHGHHVFSKTVRFSQSADLHVPVHATGAYALVFSNCGTLSGAVVSGSVAIKNTYGYLPGTEYAKMSLYMWMSLAYTLAAVVWFVFAMVRSGSLTGIQHCISVVLFLGLVEGCLWYVHLTHWNNSGEPWGCILSPAVMLSEVKCLFAFAALLFTSLGWCVTQWDTEGLPTTKIHLFVLFCMIYKFGLHHVLIFQHDFAFWPAHVITGLVPSFLLNLAFFGWILISFSRLIAELQQRDQNEMLPLVSAARMVSAAALVLAVFPCGFQVYTQLEKSCELGLLATGCSSYSWSHQWLFVDGVMHVEFFLVLICMMWLWSRQDAKPQYEAVSQMADEMADGKAVNTANVWTDDDLNNDLPGDDFASGVLPETIGASEHFGLE